MCGQADWKRRWRVERRTLRRPVGQPGVAACETGHPHKESVARLWLLGNTCQHPGRFSVATRSLRYDEPESVQRNGEIPDALGRLELEFLTSPVRTEEHKL